MIAKASLGERWDCTQSCVAFKVFVFIAIVGVVELLVQLVFRLQQEQLAMHV